VRFVPDAIVEAQMPTDPNAATTQRLRWEGGRKETIRNRSLSLLIGGIAHCDRLRLDAAFDLMCPPLAQQASGLFIWAALVAWAAIIRAPGWMNWFVLWALSACGFVLYVIGGFKVADAPRAAYTALLTAPAFIPWKIAALVRGNRPNGWHRTDRKSMETSKKTDTGPANEAP
jgi:hypothetical protein